MATDSDHDPKEALWTSILRRTQPQGLERTVKWRSQNSIPSFRNRAELVFLEQQAVRAGEDFTEDNDRNRAHSHLLQKAERRMLRLKSGELQLPRVSTILPGDTEITDDHILSRSQSVKVEVLHPTHTPWRTEIIAGVLSGSLQVLMFNPYDRALYLSMVHHRPFIDRRNWGQLLDVNRGVLPNLLQRIITYGMYFPLEQMYTRLLLSEDADDMQTLMLAPVAGQLTGGTSALLTNPLSLVKYRQYGSEKNKSLHREIRSIWKIEGAFFRGLGPTILRDSIFGSVFTFTRVLFASSEHQFFVNLCAGVLATVCAGPMNYVRNQQYAYKGKSSSGEDYPSMRRTLGVLRDDISSGPEGWWRLWNIRLRIGWGSLRVGIGMACGNQFYKFFTEALQ